MKKSWLVVAVLGALPISSQAIAGASANIGATTNYMWRGITQTQDKAAIQGGLDYAANNGLYVGTWASNTKFADTGTEVDLYAGYKKDLKGEANYDVGVIKYNYPNDNSVEFSEAYIKAGLKGVNAEVDYTLDSNDTTDAVQKGDIYYALGYGSELPKGWTYGAKVGRYNFKADGADYTHYQLTAGKGLGKAGDLALALDKAKGGAAEATNGDKDTRVSLSWKKSFDF